MIPGVSWLLDQLPRPLDPMRSIKIKVCILLGVSGLAGITVFVIGIGYVLINLVVDLVVGAVDPRTRLAGAR